MSANTRYFEELRLELDNYNYQERFLEELSDHFEDAQYANMLKGDTQNQDDPAHILGDITTVSNAFNKSMRKIYTPNFIRNIVLITIFAPVPLLLVSMISNQLYNLVPEISRTLWQVGTYATLLGSTFVYFYVSISSIHLVELSKRSLKNIALLLNSAIITVAGANGIFFILNTMSIIQGIITDDGIDKSLALSNLWHSTLSAVGLTAVAVSGYFYARLFLQAKPNIQDNNIKKILLHAAGITSTATVITWIWLSRLYGYYTEESLRQHTTLPDTMISLINLPVDILQGLQFILHLLIVIPLGFISLIIAYWFAFVISLVVIVLSAWQIANQYSSNESGGIMFPVSTWLPVITLFFAGGLLIANPTPVTDKTSKDIEWQVPAKNLTETFERKDLLFIYRAVKFINQDDGPAFTYQIGVDPGTKQYAIDRKRAWPHSREYISNVTSINNYTITNGNDNGSLDWWYAGQKNLTAENIRCVTGETKKDGTPKLAKDLPSSCKELYINDVLVYENAEEYPQLYNAVVSEDGAWALIHIHYGFYDPEDVYLVTLK